MSAAQNHHPVGRWKTYEIFPKKPQALPKFAGVYVVFLNDQLSYIGSSIDVAKRFNNYGFRSRDGVARYSQPRFPWAPVSETTRISVKVKRSKRFGDWAMREIRLIDRLRPRFNCQHKAGAA